MLNWQIGKKYKRRDGQIVVLTKRDSVSSGSWDDLIYFENENVILFAKNGRQWRTGIGRDTPSDIIEEVNEMKIEVGKWYKTRAGHKAFVAFCTPYPCLIGPYVGYVETETNLIYNWLGDGAASMGASSNNKYDLIEEWKEPKSGVAYVNVYPECVDVSAYKDRAEANKHKDNDRIACVRVEWKEGQFDD